MVDEVAGKEIKDSPCRPSRIHSTSQMRKSPQSPRAQRWDDMGSRRDVIKCNGRSFDDSPYQRHDMRFKRKMGHRSTFTQTDSVYLPFERGEDWVWAQHMWGDRWEEWLHSSCTGFFCSHLFNGFSVLRTCDLSWTDSKYEREKSPQMRETRDKKK